MGFWGSLGKFALRAAPFAAAPFTGGLSMMAYPAANAAANRIGNPPIGGSNRMAVGRYGQGGPNGQGYDPYSTTPNLGFSIEAGRRNAMMNQPWRAGYTANIGPEPADDAQGNQPTPVQMPPMYPNYGGGQVNWGPPIGGGGQTNWAPSSGSQNLTDYASAGASPQNYATIAGPMSSGRGFRKPIGPSQNYGGQY